MNAFQTIVGTLKPEQQQQQQNQQEQNNDNQPWLIVSVARAIGSIAGVGNVFFYMFDEFCNFSSLFLIFLRHDFF